MFCDKHGTLDYCPNCLIEESNSVSRSNFEDWWELKGSLMKKEPGENTGDSELPFRVAKAAWEKATQ